jgi:hypothetical protein
MHLDKNVYTKAMRSWKMCLLKEGHILEHSM